MRSIDEVRKILHYDALADAESLTGKSYKEDPLTMEIGFTQHIALQYLKREALEEIGDTNNYQTLEEHLKTFDALSFEIVLVEDFLATSEYHEPYAERMYVLWQAEKGILSVVQSYNSTRVNNSNIFYNVQLKSREDYNWLYASSHSGLQDDLVLAGGHDTREGLKIAIDGLETMGALLPVWVRPYHFHLLTYDEWKLPNVDHKAITAERFKQLPQEVQAAIGTLDV